MAQVPYTPYPTVIPQDIPTPRLAVNTPPDAFGVNIGHALQGLGSSVGQVGNELFSRAIALQDLQNETTAREADANYMMQVGDLHAKFSSLEGKDAVNAYPKYTADIENLRKQTRDSLPTAMAQKLFDSTSMSTMSRTIFNGAGHAAAEQKGWAVGASKARVAGFNDQALIDPSDERNFNNQLEAGDEEVRQQGAAKGESDDQINYNISKNHSSMWMNRIEGTARTNPFGAQKMLDDAIANGDVRGEDLEKVQRIVRQQVYTTGARNISADIRSGRDTSLGDKAVPMPAAKAAIAGNESGGDYNAIGPATKGGDRALGKYQVMQSNLPEFLSQAGLPSMTSKEFLGDQAAQEKVFETVFGGYMEKYGSFNEAASMWFSGKSVKDAGTASDGHWTVPQYLANANATLAKNTPLADLATIAESKADVYSRNDPLAGDYARDRMISDVNKQKAIKRDQDYTNMNTVDSAILTGGQGGKLPTSIEELKAVSPDVATAWGQLDAQHQKRVLTAIVQNAKGDHAWTQDSMRDYQQLKGQAYDDPASFLDEDIITGHANLPNRTKVELINLQAKLKSNSEADPRVTRALSTLAPELNAAGITKTGSKDTYYQFIGSLQDALQDFATEHKRSPKMNEVQEIGNSLLAEQHHHWWQTSQPFFSRPVPQEDADQIHADFSAKYSGITPTDEQVQRIYAADQYKKLYGGSAKKETDVPEVPQR